jgi:outer membrane receptor protein involved in Fe transport
MTKLKLSVLMCLSLAMINGLFAQNTGKLEGKVIDKKNGEELIGVSIQLEGTNFGTATDFEGKYQLKGIPEGVYNVVFSYVSYQKKVIKGVAIKSKEVTTVNTSLEESTQELSEVVITGTLKKESQNALLIQQRNAVSIGNGLSAEVIKQTPDNNTGEVMKRISGATIQQGKFAVIRGLNDRYNAAMINGSPLPSTEPERRAFSFDLIPANMVDQIIITKTATPDLPGDFAGGVIQVTTKETPVESFFNVSAGIGFNHITTGREFKSYKGGRLDWLGMDDGTRGLPSGFPTTEEIRAPGSAVVRAQREIEAGKLLNNNYAILDGTALPNGSLNLSGGRTFNFKASKLGVIFSAGYSNSNSFQQVERSWTDNAKNTQFNYTDSLYENNVRLGGLLNISYKLGKNHRFSFKNTINQQAENTTVTRVGPSQAEGIYKQAYSYMFVQNRLLLNQLNGEHFIPTGKLKVNWELSNAFTNRYMPDYKNVEYRGNTPELLQLGVINSANENAARLFTDLNEQLQTAGGSVQIPFNSFIAKPSSGNSIIRGVEDFVYSTNLKVGTFYQYKDRTFDGRMMGFARARNSGFNAALLRLPISEVFSYDNMSLNGFKLNDITNPSHSYTANSTLLANYFMFENKIGAKFKVIWGGRYEAYNQRLSSFTRNNDTVEVDTDFNDFLPSINVVYALNSTSNLRFSASKTVSRPELRELAPFSFYDFSTASSLEGNDSLQRAVIRNYDIRYEIYPSAGQVFSAAVFYKDFTNPIELVLANDITLGVIRRSFVNLPRATALGIELDYRIDISKALTAYGNFSYIQSVIYPGDNTNRWSDNRPMQGQSPYIINIGLIYKVEKLDITLSGLFNMYGDRIYNVGNTSFPDMFEQARPLLDFQITKLFFKKRLETKLGVSDILARDLVFYMDYNKNNTFQESEDVAVFRYRMPRIFTFSVGYKF